MRIELQELQNQLETTMVFVTHDQEEAMTMGDKIIVMNDGRAQQIGTPREVYNDPANLFVTNFIGSPSTNIIDGRIRASKNGTVVETDIFDLEVSAEDIDVTDGQTVTLGIRPEYLSVTEGAPDMVAEVKVVEHLGDRDALYLDVDGHELRTLVGQETVTAGESLPLHVERENVWLFDDHGNRLR
jgi:multiple sugar transport system ATP-binding protein